MNNLLTEIEKIEHKLNELISRYEKLKQENNILKAENKVLSLKVKEQEKMIEEIQNKNLNLQIVKNLEFDDSSKENVKARIDALIDEIDRCIELLSTK